MRLRIGTLFFCGVLTLVLSSHAFAGTLRIGAPSVQGNTVTFPVILDGDVGKGVSQMNFRINYDSSVLQPVSVTTGSAAAAANKDIQTNLTPDGRYNVIMFGLNQNVVGSGEVAEVVMHRKTGASAAQTNVSITNTAFSSPDAQAIPSSGSSQTVQFQSPSTDSGTAANSSSTSTATNSNTDTQSANPSQSQSTPSSTSTADKQQATTGQTNTNTSKTTAATQPNVPAGIVEPTPPPTTRDAAKSQSKGIATVTLSPPAGSTPPKPGAKDLAPSSAALTRLQQATEAAKRARSGIATPPSTANSAKNTHETPSATRATDANAPATAGTSPGSPPMTATKRQPTSAPSAPIAVASLTGTPRPSSPGVAASVKPTREPAESTAAPSTSTGGGMKWILVAVVVVILGLIFTVRRKLFS